MAFKNLDQLPAFATLQELAASPVDLTHPDIITEERISRYVCTNGEFDLLYGTQRVNADVLEALQQLADESNAVDQFVAMKSGEVINRIDGYESENRQVLHTACRDLFTNSPCEPKATAQAKRELDKLRRFLDDIDAGVIVNSDGKFFTDIVQVGIGGSDLGPRALYYALRAYKLPGRRVHFISNVDPDDAVSVLNDLDLSRTLINVVSKSGSTLETLTNEELVRAAYVKAGLDPKLHFIAVTGEGSPMDSPKYLRSFYMFNYIGGRYSVSSMVGGVMLGFALGYEAFEEILRGADRVDKAAEERDITKNIPLLMALLGIWNHNLLGCQTSAVLPYSQGLIRFAAHLQQCDMESNGKSINRQGDFLAYQSGPIVWGEPGTNGQHAFYQLIHQGTTVVPVEFVGFRESQYDQDILIQETTSQEKLVANLLAQALALAVGHKDDNPNRTFPGNRPNSILIADRLTPKTMGALLAMYEAKITFQGFIWNINSFDQEGVQLGKKLANQLLDHLSSWRLDREYTGMSSDPTGCALLQAARIVKK